MDNEIKINETEEAMKALSDFAKACYDQGYKDTLIGVVIGAGLALTGFVTKALYEELKIRKSEKELKKSIDEFCEFVNKEES